MKSSTLFSIIIASTLAAGSVAYAQGRANAPGASRAQAPATAQASAAGAQARVHTPGSGLLLGATTQQTRIHTPGTGLVTPAAVPAPAGS